MRTFFVLSLFLVLSVASPRAHGTAVDEAIAQFEQQAQQALAKEMTPGLAIAVTYKGKVVYAKGLGFKDWHHTDPVKDNTLFRLASISKVFTAVSILQMWERGLIDLDKPVTYYLPWFKQDDTMERWRQVTSRELLNHTAGLSRENGSDVWGNLPLLKTGYLPSSEELMPGALAQEMVMEPGERLKYSNFGYWILSRIVARYGGAHGATDDERYLQYVKKHFLRALGLTQSGYVLDTAKAGQLALPYGLLDNTTHSTRLALPVIYDTGGQASAWGLYSSAHDFAQLLLWLTDALQGKANPLLRPETVKMMVANPPADLNFPNVQHGLGLQVIKTPKGLRIGHAGWFLGYVSNFFVDTASGVGIFTSANNVESDRNLYWNLAFNTIGQALQGLPVSSSSGASISTPEPNYKNPPPEYKAIVGKYESLFSRVTVDYSGGTLYLHRGSDSMSMHLLSNSPMRMDFRLGFEGGYSSWIGERVTFFLDAQGHVTSMLASKSSRFFRVGE